MLLRFNLGLSQFFFFPAEFPLKMLKEIYGAIFLWEVTSLCSPGSSFTLIPQSFDELKDPN